MNQKNSEIFFGEDQEVTITVTDEDGNSMDAQIIASFEIEELNSEYLAIMPADVDPETENADITILSYSEDEDGNPEIGSIDDEDEYEIAAKAFAQLIKEGQIEGFAVSDDDDDDEEEDGEDLSGDDYLSDIGDIFPGLSIDKSK